jgi:carboxymethylenebutenolidase
MLRSDLNPLPRLRVDPEPPGSGFARAVQPVVATAVATGAEGLLAGPVTIDSNGYALPAYRAMPVGGEHLPIVLVVSEIFGVHEHIADVARRFAKLGYLAVAPELFVRQGDAKAAIDIDTLFATIVSKVPDAQVMSDLDASVAWAAEQGGDTTRLGVTGFCWGGRQTWLYAAHNPAVRAGVAWYGRLTGATNERQTAHPVERAAALKAPVLGLYGGADTGIPLDTVEAMRLALEAGSEAAKRSEIVVYPEAKHAFFADYRPSYDPASAADGWQRCLGWLRAHGAA